MKKIILTAVLLAAGWLGFSYVSAAWTRNQFTEEIDSLLASPRDLSEANLIPLILNKAQQFGMELRPENIQIRITSADRETTTSRLLESKDFRTEVHRLTLHIAYGQPFLGTLQPYRLDRDRTFTFQAAPSTPTVPTIPPLPDAPGENPEN